MRTLMVTAVLMAVMGLAGCERRTGPTPRSRTPETGATSVPKEKVVHTPEQLEEMARAKVLLALLGKGAPAEHDEVDPAPQSGR